MAKYCTKCGKELNNQGRCESCPPSPVMNIFCNILSVIKKGAALCLDRMGFGCGTAEETIDMFERNKKIVPDCVKPNEGEIPIRQYNIAKLRSRILQKYAEGRLQVTNKRIIFRATGFTLTGRTALQHEFAISEIGGIEVKKSFRISFLTMLLSILLACLVSEPFNLIFEKFNDAATTASCVIGCLVALALIVPFFLLKKKFWLKYILLSLAMGIMSGINGLMSTAVDIITGGYVFDIIDAVSSVVTFFWIFNLVIVSFVPDLRICIKTKGAGEAVQIRKQTIGISTKEDGEYTGFSEIVPGKDTDAAILEIGALIDDIQTMGDYAIEKWQDTGSINEH